jgi:hypothetical protein
MKKINYNKIPIKQNSIWFLLNKAIINNNSQKEEAGGNSLLHGFVVEEKIKLFKAKIIIYKAKKI